MSQSFSFRRLGIVLLAMAIGVPGLTLASGRGGPMIQAARPQASQGRQVQAEYEIKERPALLEGWLDTHIHLRAGDGNYASALRSALPTMNAAGVGMALVLPQPFPDVAQNRNQHDYPQFLAAVRESGGRFAFLGGGGSLNGMLGAAHLAGELPPEAIRAFTEQAERIAGDGAAGFGELAIEHLSHFPGHPYEAVPADHPLLLLLADIAARHGMPIDVHMDMLVTDAPLPAGFASPPNPPQLTANLPAFARLLAHNRTTRIVLAHCGWDVTGQWSVPLTRRLLAEHPNLFMSIKIGAQGMRTHSPLTTDGIKPEWLALLQEFPERFVVGSDSFFASAGPGPAINLAGPAALLARLPPELAAQIGYRNARRIYRLP